MTYWKYKAYDSKGDIVDGVVAGIEPLVIVTELRQESLQVFDLVTIAPSEYHSSKALSDRLRHLRRLNAKAGGRPVTKVKPAIPPEDNPAFWAVRKVLLKRRQRFITRMIYAACLFAVVLLLLFQFSR